MHCLCVRVCICCMSVCNVCVGVCLHIKVKSLLQNKLCEQLSSVLADLKLRDPQHTGHVTQEDLKKVLSCYGMPISDTHFNK